MYAQSKWRKLNGTSRMPKVIEEIAFKDGMNIELHAVTVNSRRPTCFSVAAGQVSD